MVTTPEAACASDFNRSKTRMSTPSVNESTIYQTLRQVIDPELGCNILDLGLVYSVRIEGSKVAVIMTIPTPTSRRRSPYESVSDRRLGR